MRGVQLSEDRRDQWKLRRHSGRIRSGRRVCRRLRRVRERVLQRLRRCDVSFSGTPCNDGYQCSDTDRCDGAGNCQQQTGNGCEDGDACVQEGTVCEPN
jgi:hypothetical protein